MFSIDKANRSKFVLKFSFWDVPIQGRKTKLMYDLGLFNFVAVCLLFAPLLYADAKSEEATAVVKIELLGGKITRDETLTGHPVIGVDFHGSKRVSDGFLRFLKDLPNLTSLNLRGTRITDGGVSELKRLTNLTVLDLSNTEITDEGVADIARIKSLKALYLYRTEITDSGMKELGKHKTLESLYIGGTKITDQCLQELTRLEKLTTLDVSRTEVTNEGVSELRNSLPKLFLVR